MTIKDVFTFSSLFVTGIVAYAILAFNPITCTIIGVIAYFCFGVATVASLATVIAIVAVCWPIALILGIIFAIGAIMVLCYACYYGPQIIYNVLAICGQIIIWASSGFISGCFYYSEEFAMWIGSLFGHSDSTNKLKSDKNNTNFDVDIDIEEEPKKIESEQKSCTDVLTNFLGINYIMSINTWF